MTSETLELEFPCPPLSLSLELGEGVLKSDDGLRLPTHPAVFFLQDRDGGTVLLATTSNLRRNVASKLAEVEPGQKRSRQNYRGAARWMKAILVGSQFEADWTYLQWARRLLPHSYRGLLDRWQAWFIHCEPNAAYPQFVKSAHPKPDEPGVCLGPFPEKHSAGKYMDLLQDVFDLCRYHHILVQAPRATACAYKEMGRCPAPCDGTVTMDAFRGQFQQAIDFACQPFATWQANVEQTMKAASDAQDFERAQRLRNQFVRAKAASRAEFSFIDRLERFAFIALMPTQRKEWFRLFLIKGGWIAPLADLDLRLSPGELSKLSSEILAKHALIQPVISQTALENMGMVCWHLFRAKHSRQGAFVRFGEAREAKQLTQAIRRLQQRDEMEDASVPDQDFSIL